MELNSLEWDHSSLQFNRTNILKCLDPIGRFYNRMCQKPPTYVRRKFRTHLAPLSDDAPCRKGEAFWHDRAHCCHPAVVRDL